MSQPTHPERAAPAADVAEILRLHQEWWQANVTGDIPRMVKVFPAPGHEYLMFNVNGHTYLGMEEKVRIWEHYGALLGDTAVDIRVLRLEVRGDLGWIAAEGSVEPRTSEGAPLDASAPVEYVRSTEIYQRDDGGGRPRWRMWHFHASFQEPPTAPRPGFENEPVRRALGEVPWPPLPTMVP